MLVDPPADRRGIGGDRDVDAPVDQQHLVFAGAAAMERHFGDLEALVGKAHEVGVRVVAIEASIATLRLGRGLAAACLTTSGGRGPRTGRMLSFGYVTMAEGLLAAPYEVAVAGECFRLTALARPPYDPDGLRMRQAAPEGKA